MGYGRERTGDTAPETLRREQTRNIPSGAGPPDLLSGLRRSSPSPFLPFMHSCDREAPICPRVNVAVRGPPRVVGRHASPEASPARSPQPTRQAAAPARTFLHKRESSSCQKCPHTSAEPVPSYCGPTMQLLHHPPLPPVTAALPRPSRMMPSRHSSKEGGLHRERLHRPTDG